MSVDQAVGEIEERTDRYRWQVFAVTWSTYVSYYLTRQSFSVVKAVFADPTQNSGVSISRAGLGQIGVVDKIAYACGQFVWGPLGDRLGPRRVLIVGMLLSIAAAIGSGFSRGLTAFLLFSAIQGLAQSTGWATLVKTMSAWLSLGKRGRVMGWWCTNYTVGAAIAGPFAAWSMAMFTRSSEGSFWPAAYWGPAAALAVMLGFVIAFHVSRPEDVALPAIDAAATHSNVATAPEPSDWHVIRAVAAMPSVWILSVAYFAIKLARYALTDWGILYIAERLGSDVGVSAITSAALPIGGVMGVLSAGYLSDHLFGSRRMPIAIGFLVLCATTLLAGRLLPIDTVPLMACYFFLIGYFLYGPDSLISATSAIDNGTRKGAGTAAGIINGVGSFGAVAGVYLPGTMTSRDDWSPLFNVFIGGLVISAMMLAPLWNMRPRKTTS